MKELHESQVVVERLLQRLEGYWNESDSDGFAANFHPEADFVDVLGRIFRGREAIATIHQKNFATIHAGSRLTLSRLSSRRLSETVLLAHAKASIEVPSGPLAGRSFASQTLVLEGEGEAWKIRAFHNTFVREMPGVPGLE